MKAISIFLGLVFFLGSLLPKFDLEELGQVDELYEHYLSHVQLSNGNLSFGNFLSMHYSNQEHDTEENHERLPFHHHECNVAITCAMLPEILYSFHTTPLSDKLPIPVYEQVNYSEYAASIWQPPKL